jgi:NAD(P)H-flavin reductase
MPKIEILHGCAKGSEPLTPIPSKVIDIVQETRDVKSFKIQTNEGTKPFDCEPGQLGIFGDIYTGECMFCVSAQSDGWIEFTVKRVGEVTEHLHELRVGDQCTVRGPYGNWWPYDSCKGADMLFIAGGIGLPPVRAFLLYCLQHREDYGRIDLVYSAASKADLVFKEDLFENWPLEPDMGVHVSVYHGSDDWDGDVAYTAPYLESLGLDPTNRVAVLCGGPSLYRTCSESLSKMGYPDDQVITTLEMRMKCGVGKCGRCNIGGRFICLDGPVFTQAEVKAMKRDA